MPILVFVMILFSALFQAAWNFQLKKITIDKTAFLLVSWLFFGAVGFPFSFLFLDKPIALSWWPFILCTSLVQAVYLLLVSWAYTVAEISLVFPLARGVGVGLSAIILSFIGVQNISPWGFAGVFAVAMGAVFLGSAEFHLKGSRTGILLAMALASITTMYMVIDYLGAKEIPLVFYVLSMNFFAPLFAFPFLWPKKKTQIRQAWKDYKWQAFLGAMTGSTGYFILLWTYEQTPAPYVIALREMSIVFAALMGIYFLKEKIYPRKIAAIALILVGIVLLKLA